MENSAPLIKLWLERIFTHFGEDGHFPSTLSDTAKKQITQCACNLYCTGYIAGPEGYPENTKAQATQGCQLNQFRTLCDNEQYLPRVSKSQLVSYIKDCTEEDYALLEKTAWDFRSGTNGIVCDPGDQ